MRKLLEALLVGVALAAIPTSTTYSASGRATAFAENAALGRKAAADTLLSPDRELIAHRTAAAKFY